MLEVAADFAFRFVLLPAAGISGAVWLARNVPADFAEMLDDWRAGR